jgi:hypothetical protein
MRVSVVNFCSTAVDMLKFSSRELVKNAGTSDFDYIVMTWNPSEAVQEYLDEQNNFIIQAQYGADPSLDYVPNLRRMFNEGFHSGYLYNDNDYVCIVNTDMMFGKDWLINLMKRASLNIIPNSLHISPILGPNIITYDFGIPTDDTFYKDRFWQLHDKLFEHKIETENERGGWEATQTLPYIIHKKWWDECGPWDVEVKKGHPPDRMFFERVHDAGGKYVLCHDSICYHHEAVERRSGVRPVGMENMQEGS